MRIRYLIVIIVLSALVHPVAAQALQESHIKVVGTEFQLVSIPPGSFTMGSYSGDGDERPVHKITIDYSFEIGKTVTLREGNDVTIAATGSMVIKALKAHDELAQQGIKARVINVHTIKPLDTETILQAAKETGGIVTAEEHSVIGGLGGAVAEVLAETGVGRLKRVGIQDTFCTTIGSHEELCEIYGLTTKSIAQAAKTLVS